MQTATLRPLSDRCEAGGVKVRPGAGGAWEQAGLQAGDPPQHAADELPVLQATIRTDSIASGEVAKALKYGLELMERGALLVDGAGFPCLANQSALDILSRKDGLSVGRTGLVADRASDTRLLRSLLCEVASSPQPAEPKDSTFLAARKSGKLALIVRVMPGPELSAWPGKDARTALVTISNPDNCLRLNEQDLSRLYGLTRGEAALAGLIVQGKSLEESAAALFISPHTARTHLKRIFLKTDTHRQPELVVRLLSSVL